MLVEMEDACVVDAASVTTWCCVELVTTASCVVVACPVFVVVAKTFGAGVTIPLVEVVCRGINASVVACEVVVGVVVEATVTTWCCVELVTTASCVVVACPVFVVVAKNFGAGVVVEAIFICVVVATNFGTSHALVTLFLTYPRTQTHSLPL